MVEGLENLKNSKGEKIESSPVMALCRCGASKNKPFCNGSNWNADFKDEKN